MNVSKVQPDALNYQVTIEIAAADYAESLHKRLNEYKRKADIKGFRKGMAPLSLIQRLYGDRPCMTVSTAWYRTSSTASSPMRKSGL